MSEPNQKTILTKNTTLSPIFVKKYEKDNKEYMGYVFASLDTEIKAGKQKPKQTFNIIDKHPTFNNIEIKINHVYQLTYKSRQLEAFGALDDDADISIIEIKVEELKNYGWSECSQCNEHFKGVSEKCQTCDPNQQDDPIKRERERERAELPI